MFLVKKKQQRQEDLDVTKDLIALLKERILNKEALNGIIEKIYYGERNGNIAEISRDGVAIVDKKSGDCFTLHITDWAILTDYTCWNGHHQEKKAIVFDGDMVVIDYQEVTNYVWASSGEPSGTERKAVTEVYKDNLLLYKREFTSSTDSDLQSFLDFTVLTETFVNGKREAVVRKIATGDYQAFHQPGVTYSKCDYLDEPPYDTAHYDRSCYINGFSAITEEEFMAFFDTLEKVDYAPSLKKIEYAPSLKKIR